MMLSFIVIPHCGRISRRRCLRNGLRTTTTMSCQLTPPPPPRLSLPRAGGGAVAACGVLRRGGGAVGAESDLAADVGARRGLRLAGRLLRLRLTFGGGLLA